MQFSHLLMVSCVGCYLAAAAPEHRSVSLHNGANLEHSERDPNLLKFIHKLLHTLQNDYQDPNWPRNLHQITKPTLSDDCAEEERRSVIHVPECDDNSDNSDEKKKRERVDAHGGFYHNPDHVCGEVYVSDSYEQSKPSKKLQKAMKESSEMNRKENVYKESSKSAITSSDPENRKPKLMRNSKNSYHITTQIKSEERRALQELLHKRLSDFHLPRIQINQFGTNKVEQNLYHQPKLLGSMNKNQREDILKRIGEYTNINYVQPHKVGSRKFSTFDDEDEEQRDHQVGNTERTLPIVSNKNTEKKSHNKQNYLESNGYHSHDSSPIVSATQSSIEYSDVDINIGRNTDIQGKIYEQPKQSYLPVVLDQHKTANLSKVADQPILLGQPKVAQLPKVPDLPKVVPDLSKATDQPILVGQPKVTHLPKVPDLPEVSEHPKVSDQPKVPDQPKIIIDDITEATTEHTINFRFTTAADFSTEKDLLDKKTAETEKNVSPAIDVTTLPAIDDSKKIDSEDESSQRSKKTKDTGIVTPTLGTPRDQAAEGTHYYPLNLNEGGHDRSPLKFIHTQARHGVPIAYESDPRASASLDYSNYYIPRIKKPLQRIAKSSPFSRASTDRFATIQHEIDYDDYGDYDTQLSYPIQYRLNAPASTVYWSSIHRPRHGKSVRNSLNSGHKYAKQPRFKEPQSLFEQAAFDDADLTSGWEDWEPSYTNDMLHERSYLRPAL